jgi:Fe-S cluster assembly protein SufD
MSEISMETAYQIDVQHSDAPFILPESLRNEAQNILATIDFPTTRTEAWKYTRVAKIKNTQFRIQQENTLTKSDVEAFLIPNVSGSVFVFVNGFYAENLSTLVSENGLDLIALSKIPHFNEKIGTDTRLENEIFTAINTVYAQDGIGIKIAKNAQIEQTVQVIFISIGTKTYAGNRNIISCGDFAKAHIVMNYVSLNAENTFNNTVSEIYVGTNAHLTIDKIQQESNTNYSINSEFVHQEKDSNFTINTITVDGLLVRNNLEINVNGQNCESNLSGAYILKDKQLVDNHTVVDHKVANCQSNELYKGVIDDQATAVFNGKVFVRQDAQKINAFQSNGNVLLSDSATINSKPELEIYADDVKCSHGSTTGQLDEEAVFYLRARGLSEKSARALMVTAFIGEVLEKIEDEAVNEYVNDLIFTKFGWVR